MITVDKLELEHKPTMNSSKVEAKVEAKVDNDINENNEDNNIKDKEKELIKSFIPTLESIDPRNIQRLLLPLDGEEVIKAILGHIETKLRNAGIFEQHIIFEEARWKFNLFVDWAGFMAANNQYRLTDNAAVVSKVEDSVKESSEPISNQAKLEGQHMDKTMAPDEIREKTNQPIPALMTKGGSVGNTVRVPVSKFSGNKNR